METGEPRTRNYLLVATLWLGFEATTEIALSAVFTPVIVTYRLRGSEGLRGVSRSGPAQEHHNVLYQAAISSPIRCGLSSWIK